MKILPNHLYVRRDGGLARVYDCGLPGTWSVHGASYAQGCWYVRTWLADGTWCNTAHALDLIECLGEFTVEKFVSEAKQRMLNHA